MDEFAKYLEGRIEEINLINKQDYKGDDVFMHLAGYKEGAKNALTFALRHYISLNQPKP